MRSFSPVRGRVVLALVGVLAAASATAQGTASQPGAPAPAAPAAPAPAPAAATAPAASPVDDATREALRREIEKAKAELRDEIRAEIQGQQAAKEFLEGAEGEERKLEFLQIDGYLRFRGDLFSNLDLNRRADPLGFYPYPRPLISPEEHGTLTSSNMRLRLQPTMNVSEQIRVHAQVDVLDNLVLGSTSGTLLQPDSPSALVDPRTSSDFRFDRDTIRVKRAWAEVQTPVGLLAFGRQRAEWGLGVLEHAGEGIDDDYGDSVDRLQFAIPLRSTPLGPLTVVPIYDLVSTGVTTSDPRFGAGIGQAIDGDPSDDAKAFGFKIVRAETAEERKLKLDQGLSSTNLGLYYSYRSQGYGASNVIPAGATAPAPAVKRDASAHVLDLWARWQSKRWRLEAEGTGVLGQITNAAATGADPATGQVIIRQFGGVLQSGYTPGGHFSFATEAGIASGDRAPGMGNHAERGRAPARSIDGAQFGAGDRDFRNFRFNPAYRVDLVLWREILGSVTDAWYLKPTFRYEIIDGLAAQASIVYSQAVRRESTPSGTHKPLGLEGDLGLHYKSDDGFIAWLDWGLLQPLDGFNGAGDLSRAHALRSGLAVKF